MVFAQMNVDRSCQFQIDPLRPELETSDKNVKDSLESILWIHAATVFTVKQTTHPTQSAILHETYLLGIG